MHCRVARKWPKSCLPQFSQKKATQTKRLQKLHHFPELLTPSGSEVILGTKGSLCLKLYSIPPFRYWFVSRFLGDRVQIHSGDIFRQASKSNTEPGVGKVQCSAFSATTVTTIDSVFRVSRGLLLCAIPNNPRANTITQVCELTNLSARNYTNGCWAFRFPASEPGGEFCYFCTQLAKAK